MKEFLVYTLMRLSLLGSSFLLVLGLWGLLADEIPIFGVLLVALVISAVASYFLLQGPRNRLAAKLEERTAARMRPRVDEVDDPS